VIVSLLLTINLGGMCFFIGKQAETNLEADYTIAINERVAHQRFIKLFAFTKYVVNTNHALKAEIDKIEQKEMSRSKF
jgi:hypothetical protein